MNLKMLLFASVSLVLFASCHNSDDPYMTLATKTLDVEAEGGLFTVDLASNVYYRVNNDCQAEDGDNHWAVVDSHETQGDITKFTIKVSENSSTSSRVGAIRFIGDDVSGAIPGDYWYVYGDMEGTIIPAGTKIHFYFVTKLGTMCSNYWMIEFKDGEEWKPALPTSTLQESATETLSGAPINYSAVITYNFAAMLLDASNNGAYIPAEGIFTTTKDMEEIVLRFGQAGRLCLSGARYAGKYIDCTHASGQTRFSAQHPSNPDTGAAIREYNEHVLLEIVE